MNWKRLFAVLRMAPLLLTGLGAFCAVLYALVAGNPAAQLGLGIVILLIAAFIWGEELWDQSR